MILPKTVYIIVFIIIAIIIGIILHKLFNNDDVLSDEDYDPHVHGVPEPNGFGTVLGVALSIYASHYIAHYIYSLLL